MTAPCFVDANVFVYACDPADLRKQAVAQGVLERLWVEQSGRTSIQALNEFYTVVTGKLRHVVSREKAWDQVESFLQWFPQVVDAEVMRRAHRVEKQFRLSWWDALMVAAAQLQGCRILFSEDLQHGAVYDSVQVRDPFLDQVNELPPPDYVPAPRPTPHRPRGRPRKHPPNP